MLDDTCSANYTNYEYELCCRTLKTTEMQMMRCTNLMDVNCAVTGMPAVSDPNLQTDGVWSLLCDE